MEINNINDLLKNNTYPGRGIVVGTSADGKNAYVAYFIMGRSDNSRNRIFSQTEDGIIIYPFDYSKVEDPSLIIYSPVRSIGKEIIVTNGDQTDTVYDFIKQGKTFEQALETRCFEPDSPNFTPRISAILNFESGYSYKMSILKSADEKGTDCNRYTFSYAKINGVGHFIHTYNSDGNPIPTFSGEPERISIGNNFEDFSNGIWTNLNDKNKISLYAFRVNLETKEKCIKIFNKNKGD